MSLHVAARRQSGALPSIRFPYASAQTACRLAYTVLAPSGGSFAKASVNC